MGALAYSNQREDSYSTQGPAQQAAPGFAQATEQGSQGSAVQSMDSDTIKQYLALDPVVKARAEDALGLSPKVNTAGQLTPREVQQVLVEAARHQGAASEQVPGTMVTPEVLDEAKRALVMAKGRAAGATSQYRDHEARGGTFWGAQEGAAAEWLGGAQALDPSLEGQANMAIARLEALTNQGEQANLAELRVAQRTAMAEAINWSNAVGEYTGQRAAGGESAVDALETTRDGAADIIAIGATGGGGFVAGAATAAATNMIGQGVTELAAVEAGVQDGDGLQRVGMAGLKSGAMGLLAGGLSNKATKLLAPRLVKRIVAASGNRMTEEAAKKVAAVAVEQVVGQSMSKAADWVSQQGQPSADQLAEHVDGAYGDAIVKKAQELAEQDAAASD
jgi:hypothetical protein